MLDKSKPYGEVWGGAPYRYEQNRKYFNPAGMEVDESGNVIEKSVDSTQVLSLKTKDAKRA